MKRVHASAPKLTSAIAAEATKVIRRLFFNVLSPQLCSNPAALYPRSTGVDCALEQRTSYGDALKLDRLDCIGVVFEHGRHL
jgi:hypothetical protein